MTTSSDGEAGPVDDGARRELGAIFAKYPDRLAHDARWCRALLRDLLTDFPRELRVLLAAIDEGVPATLWLPSADTDAPAVAIPRFIDALVDRGFNEFEARWAVESWALVLGLGRELVPVSHPSRVACGRCGSPQAPMTTVCAACGAPTLLLDPPADEMTRLGTLYRYAARLRAVLPADWSVEESLTIRQPRGLATVTVTTRPIARTLDTRAYARALGEVLADEYEGYRELSLERGTVFGTSSGYVRDFDWSPDDGTSMWGIEAYLAEDGLGVRASATVATSDRAVFEQPMRMILRSLRLDSGP